MTATAARSRPVFPTTEVRPASLEPWMTVALLDPWEALSLALETTEAGFAVEAVSAAEEASEAVSDDEAVPEEADESDEASEDDEESEVPAEEAVAGAADELTADEGAAEESDDEPPFSTVVPPPWDLPPASLAVPFWDADEPPAAAVPPCWEEPPEDEEPEAGAVELFALVLGLLLGLALVPLTEPEPPLDDDDPLLEPEPDVDPEAGVMAASVGETTFAWPEKSHAVLAFFWLA